MATTGAFTSATPYSLIFSAIGDGAGGDLTVARADVLAACHAGPLKELLNRTTSWASFNLIASGNRLVQVREVIDRTTGHDSNPLKFWWIAQGFHVLVNGACQFEIRLPQSERR
jgi:hypothetical protein